VKRNRGKNAQAVKTIDHGLRQLRRGLVLLARAGSSTNHAPKPRRRVTTGLRLQGRYMGTIRTLSIKKRAKCRALRAKSGVVAAIRLARSFQREKVS